MFSRRKDRGKTIVVKHGKVVVDGTTWTVKWTSNVKGAHRRAPTDGSKQIISVEEKPKGKVLLDDQTSFENPPAWAITA